MKKQRIILLAICAAALSCTRIAVDEDPHLISISTSVEAQTESGTKATFITAANLPQYRMHIEAYTTGSATNYLASNALEENGKWIFFKGNYKDYKYYWPDFKLDFLAYSPYNLAKTNVTMNSYAAGAPSFTYTGVSPVTIDSQADSQQTEFVCSFLSDCAYSTHNPVPFKMHHPFSKLYFKLAQSIRCTIKSVRITGVLNSGTATILEASPYASWSPTGDRTTVEADFSSIALYSENGGIRYPEDINNQSILAGPFVVVPQDISSDATIEVTYKALGAEHFTIVSSKLDKAAKIGTTTAITQWLPSNAYTYALTLNGAANEIFVAVKLEDWIVNGETLVEVK